MTETFEFEIILGPLDMDIDAYAALLEWGNSTLLELVDSTGPWD